MVKTSQVPTKKENSKRARQKAFILKYSAAGFNASETCRQIGIARQTYTRWLATDPRFVEDLNEAIEARLDEIEAALMSQIRQGNITGIIFALKTIGKSRGYVEGSPVRVKDIISSKVAEILDKVLVGELKPEDAGLELDKLGHPVPEGLKLLIQKSEVAKAPSDDGWRQSDIEDELERLYQEQMAAIEEQKKKWLPCRQEEIQEIKEELKGEDSWDKANKRNR